MNSAAASPVPVSESNSAPQRLPHFCPPTPCGSSFTPTALVADYSRRPPLGIRRTFVHLRPALGVATLLAAHGAAWAWLLFALTFAVRLAVGSLLRRPCFTTPDFPQRITPRYSLLPLRDLIAPFVWAAVYGQPHPLARRCLRFERRPPDYREANVAATTGGCEVALAWTAEGDRPYASQVSDAGIRSIAKPAPSAGWQK